MQMIPDTYYITSFGFGRPLWILAIEWWLYMLFGLLYFFYSQSFSWKYLPLLLLITILHIHQEYSAKFAFLIAAFIFFMPLYQQNNYQNYYTDKLSNFIKFCAGYIFTFYLTYYTILDIIVSLDLDYNKFTLLIGSFLLANVIAIALVAEMKHKIFAQKLKYMIGEKNA